MTVSSTTEKVSPDGMGKGALRRVRRDRGGRLLPKVMGTWRKEKRSGGKGSQNLSPNSEGDVCVPASAAVPFRCSGGMRCTGDKLKVAQEAR